MGNDLFRHFATGVWVFIFGLVAIPLYMLWAGMVYVGGLSDNPALLTVLTVIWLVALIVISGWAARMGVGRVR